MAPPGADPVLDNRARAAYQARLAELDQDIDDATADNDPERAACAAAERDSLISELTRALGLGGRSRRLGDDTDRARKAVTARIGVTERVLDVPIRAVVGGLHLPVHAAGTPLVPQAVVGNPSPPWRPISERDAEHVLDEIAARGPHLVALSGHDSTPWTYGAFERRFGGRYHTLRVGEQLRITAPSG